VSVIIQGHRTGYIDPIVEAVQRLERRLTSLYDINWRLRIERESRGVWRCHWDYLTPDGEMLGGGSESFTVNVNL
jgi:hypothetical protein